MKAAPLAAILTSRVSANKYSCNNVFAFQLIGLFMYICVIACFDDIAEPSVTVAWAGDSRAVAYNGGRTVD